LDFGVGRERYGFVEGHEGLSGVGLESEDFVPAIAPGLEVAGELLEC
jgi:hypothetical protein